MAPVPHGMEGYAKRKNSLVHYCIEKLYTGGDIIISTIYSSLRLHCFAIFVEKNFIESCRILIALYILSHKGQQNFMLSFFVPLFLRRAEIYFAYLPIGCLHVENEFSAILWKSTLWLVVP